MVTRLTNYTKQRYVCNSTDDPGDIVFRNGDTVFLMDTQQESIYSEENNQWYPVPAAGGGGGDVASGTSVAVNNAMVIPKVAGKSNFCAYVDGDSAYVTQGAAIMAMRLSWITNTGVYSMKISNPGTTPPQASGSTHSAGYVTETDDSISIKFPNSNTVGLLPDGTTVKYMWW